MPAAPAIQFKGSGWYVTDYAGKNSGSVSTDKSESNSKEPAAKSESNPKEPAAKPESKEAKGKSKPSEKE